MKTLIRLILAVILFVLTIPQPMAAGQAAYPDSVTFERVKEGPTSVVFRVTVTGDGNWTPTASLRNTSYPAQVSIMKVSEVQEAVKSISKPVMAERAIQVSEIEKYLKNNGSPKAQQALDAIASRKAKGEITDSSPKFSVKPDIEAVKEIVPDTIRFVSRIETELRPYLVKTPKAVVTHGNAFSMPATGLTTYEVTISYPSRTRAGSYGSKGLLVLNINGRDYFDSTNSSWWDNAWTYRNTLSFKAATLSGPITNFPVAVYLNSSRIDFSKVRPGGADIRFVDADDSTALEYEIEYWDDIGETAQLWVRIPTLSNVDYTDYFYIYYGNAAASDASDPNATWADTGAQAVVHFSENTGATAADSTAGGNDATLIGATWDSYAMATADGTQYATLANESNFDFDTGNARTLMAWVKTADTSMGTGDVISKRAGGGYPGYGTRWTATGTGNLSDYSLFSGANGFKLTTTSTFNDNVWHQAVSTYDGSNALAGFKLYKDQTSLSISAGLNNPTADSWLNDTPVGINTSQYGSSSLNALWDEIRIYNRVLSADEIKANFLSYMDALIFFGSEDPPPSVSTLAVTDAALDATGSHATLRGNLSGLGGAPEVTIKWQWGYAADALTNETATQVKTATGIYSTTISHFSPTGAVYYRFVGTNTDGTAYGATMSFTTSLPTWYLIARFIPLFAVLSTLAVGVLLARDGSMTIRKWAALFITLAFSLVAVQLVVAFIEDFV